MFLVIKNVFITLIRKGKLIKSRVNVFKLKDTDIIRISNVDGKLYRG